MDGRMKAARTFIFLLVTFTGLATCLFTKKHTFVNVAMAWADAQTFCRNNFVDMSSIGTEDEYNLFKTQTVANSIIWAWIGLSKSPTVKNFTQWSDGSLLIFQMWKYGEPNSPDQEHCVLTSYNEWYDYICTNPLVFFCYVYEPRIILVNELKTWPDALKYCRSSYTDLISLNTLSDWAVASNKSLVNQTLSVWTGLHFKDGSWFWVNNDTYNRLLFMPPCPSRPWHCGARNTKLNIMEFRDCGETMNFLCYDNKTL